MYLFYFILFHVYDDRENYNLRFEHGITEPNKNQSPNLESSPDLLPGLASKEEGL